MNDTSPAVEVHDLRYSYGDRVALAGVGFAVARGEVHCFLGPNGSGKSTLFKILATILPPQAGRAMVLGHDVGREMGAIRRRIGVVFQSPALDRKISVRRNLAYAGQLYGLRGRELRTRVEEVLELTALGDRAGERVEQLSGGLKRRVELAKGLLARPELVLLDEPSTGLDPGARKDLWQFLRAHDDLTVLCTTHLMDEAEGADRITILHEGRVVAEGTPQELEREVGDEVLEIATAEPGPLGERIAARFGVDVRVVEHSVRIRAPRVHHLVGELIDEFGDAVERLTLSHPTLEDVFILKTGHRFFREGA